MHRGNSLGRNGSGYLDDTACKAIIKADKYDQAEKDRLDDLLDVLKYIIDSSDFELVEHIVLRDKKTGRVWR